MILQERNQIRLVVSTYDTDYVKYITNKSSSLSRLSLMEMAEYGPWEIKSAEDMAKLGLIILALTLQGGNLQH